MTAAVRPLLVLASASPRRAELLARLGIPFVVQVSDVDETVQPGEDAVDLVRRLSVAKAEVALANASADDTDVVVVAADTVVVLDHEILGKPRDEADAASMLRRLSARTHVVFTGVAVGRRTAAPPPTADGPLATALAESMRLEVAVEATEVTLTELTPADIDWYVATGEPADKAGAYAVQGAGAVFVSSLRGSADNVIGLPLAVTRRLLAEVGADPIG